MLKIHFFEKNLVPEISIVWIGHVDGGEKVDRLNFKSP